MHSVLIPMHMHASAVMYWYTSWLLHETSGRGSTRVTDEIMISSSARSVFVQPKATRARVYVCGSYFKMTFSLYHQFVSRSHSRPRAYISNETFVARDMLATIELLFIQFSNTMCGDSSMDISTQEFPRSSTKLSTVTRLVYRVIILHRPLRSLING